MFELIKCIYRKNKMFGKFEMYQVFFVINALLQDRDMVPAVQNAMNFIYEIEPTHLMYLLYYTTPKKYNMPRFSFKKKEDKSEVVSEFMQNLAKYFSWSNKEIGLYKEFVKEM